MSERLLRIVYELANIVYDHMDCEDSNSEDCEVLEDLLEELGGDFGR